jgi:peptide deformylase
MSLLPIITLPDEKILREVSKPVAVIDSNVRKLWDDMLETMYRAPGIGLAAIQVGVPQRLLVIDLSKDGEEKTPLFVANPEVVWQSEAQSDYEEGCLSIPEYYEMVTRPAEIKSAISTGRASPWNSTPRG